MAFDGFNISTIREDNIDYCSIEILETNEELKSKLEEEAKKAKGYWKIKYKNNYSYIKDGYLAKEIANNRVYQVIQIETRAYARVDMKKEYELTKDYEYSQIEYTANMDIGGRILTVIYLKNGLRHNDLDYAEFNLYGNLSNAYWIDGILITIEEFKTYKRTQLIDRLLNFD